MSVLKYFYDLQFWIAFALAPILLSGYQELSFGRVFFHLISGGELLRLVIAFPVLEEVIFRGIIQEYFYSFIWGKRLLFSISVANITTSLIFASLHFIYHPPFFAVAVFIPSLVFGYFRDRWGSVVPSIILHCWYNFVWFSFFF